MKGSTAGAYTSSSADSKPLDPNVYSIASNQEELFQQLASFGWCGRSMKSESELNNSL